MISNVTQERSREKPLELVLHDLHDHGVDIFNLWTEEVEKRTKGRVHFTKYTGKDPRLKGPADVVRDVPAKGGYYHLLDLIQTPLIIPNSVVGSKVIAQLYAEFAELRDELSDEKIVGLGTGAHMAIFSNRNWGPIGTLEDLKGARIRSLKPIDKAIEALGGRPVHVDYLDMSRLLEVGEIDATVLGLVPARMFKLAEGAAPYCTIVGGLSLTMHPMRLFMNWDSWNMLPVQIQRTIEEIGPSGSDCWYATHHGLDFDKHVTQAIEYIKKHGEMIRLANKELDRWRQLMGTVLSSSLRAAEARGLPGRLFYNRMLEIAAEYSQ